MKSIFSTKGLTEEQMERNKKVNKKILIGFAVLFAPILLMIIFSDKKSVPKEYKKEEVVFNSPLDGSVFQVEYYLKRNLNDPDSYDGIEWSEVQKLDGGGFRVRHKFRAANAFGGKVITTKLFELDSLGNVVNAIDL